jgi:hypothetical protein
MAPAGYDIPPVRYPLLAAPVSECYSSLCDQVHLRCDTQKRDVGTRKE